MSNSEILRQWVFVAWHLKGAAGTLEQWERMGDLDRDEIEVEVRRRVDLANSSDRWISDMDAVTRRRSG